VQGKDFLLKFVSIYQGGKPQIRGKHGKNNIEIDGSNLTHA